MRKSFLMLTSALAVSMAAGSAQASTGWYVGLSGGANWLEDSDASTVTPGGLKTPAVRTDTDTGWIVTGQIGYKWASNWRIEFELGYRENDGTLDTLAGVPIAGTKADSTQFTQMVNVLYDFPITDKITFSAGAGVGGDLIDVSAVGFGGTLNDDDYVLAGQLIAQVSYALNNRLDLYLDYHYTVTDEPEFSNAALAPNTGTFEVDNHAVMIGLRYDLSPDAAPAVYVPPPAPPTPTATPKQFIVFFGFNKSNLTSDAQRVVAEAAAAAKASGSASILVTGHTDTVGSNRYNDRLSMRRANAVKDELVRQGIGAGQISAVGKGETELLVQTGDNVKEPQNRRATIDLN
jgi:outer membrane protein OmpA-like peptidoglycan-associated protein